jgi:hypothetical protein
LQGHDYQKALALRVAHFDSIKGGLKDAGSAEPAGPEPVVQTSITPSTPPDLDAHAARFEALSRA